MSLAAPNPDRSFPWLIASLTALFPETSLAQRTSETSSGPRTMIIARLADESIRLDGALDESVWKRAEPAGDFMQIDRLYKY